MKVTDDYLARAVSLDVADVSMVIDRTVTVGCPHCNQLVRVPESVVSHASERELKIRVKMLNDYIEEVRQAAIEYFGEDVAHRFLVDKLAKMRADFYTPDLKVVKGGNQKPMIDKDCCNYKELWGDDENGDFVWQGDWCSERCEYLHEDNAPCRECDYRICNVEQ
jgi:hypothetical protein